MARKRSKTEARREAAAMADYLSRISSRVCQARSNVELPTRQSSHSKPEVSVMVMSTEALEAQQNDDEFLDDGEDESLPEDSQNENLEEQPDGKIEDLSCEEHDKILSSMLINYQVSTQTSDAGMDKLLDIINFAGRLKGLKGELVPRSIYMLRKQYKASMESIGIRFVCKGCGSLSAIVYRKISGKYPDVVCSNCGGDIDPAEEYLGTRGYYVVINPIERLRAMLEHPRVNKKISFYNGSTPKNYGTLQSGSVYAKSMRKGDLSVTFSSDGVKIFNTSSTNFWPCLLTLNELDNATKRQFVMPVCIYYGNSKPEAARMVMAVDEFINEMTNKGINWKCPISGLSKATIVRCILGVFDSQAKYDFMGILSPTGSYSCPRCYIQGVKVGYTMEFRFQKDLEPRWTEDWEAAVERLKKVKLASNRGVTGVAPISRFSSYDVVLSTTIDILHCVDRGVGRKLAWKWLSCSPVRSKYFKDNITSAMMQNEFERIKTPANFPKVIRKIEDFSEFKASEWHIFILYIAPFYLKPFLKDDYYKHYFILSFCYGRLLQPSITKDDLKLCKKLLDFFCERVPVIYEAADQSHNLHMLRHLTEVRTLRIDYAYAITV